MKFLEIEHILKIVIILEQTVTLKISETWWGSLGVLF